MTQKRRRFSLTDPIDRLPVIPFLILIAAASVASLFYVGDGQVKLPENRDQWFVLARSYVVLLGIFFIIDLLVFLSSYAIEPKKRHKYRPMSSVLSMLVIMFTPWAYHDRTEKILRDTLKKK